ncbi:14978_t:CDS:2 [Dentiscutata erythropus]|uniref:14978_t:CDS:1 n=1 Tax=Dentiscutata erythropus TaxID=1348616 RepID=A0A9N9ARV0_9GLOM|nr:14978_t:CDS:2 [Dentiscutata erythropus]
MSAEGHVTISPNWRWDLPAANRNHRKGATLIGKITFDLTDIANNVFPFKTLVFIEPSWPL